MRALRVALVGWAGFAWAMSGPPAVRAIEGDGFIDAKRVDEGAVILGGESYQVTERTVFEGLHGERLSLSELPTLEEGATSAETNAWFDWHGTRRERVLDELRIRDLD